MSRLTKYLESLMSKKDSCKEAKTTSSIYYSIDGVKIRVSDHFPIDYSNDISIINPLNESTAYLVQVKEGPQVLQFSLKDLKVFISNYCYIKKISSLNKEVKVAKKSIKKNEVIEEFERGTFKTFKEVVAEAQNKVKNKKKRNIPYLISVLPYTKEGLTWLELTTWLSSTLPEYEKFRTSKTCRGILRDYLYNRSKQEIKEVITYLFKNNMFDDSDKLKNYFLYEEKREE